MNIFKNNDQNQLDKEVFENNSRLSQSYPIQEISFYNQTLNQQNEDIILSDDDLTYDSNQNTKKIAFSRPPSFHSYLPPKYDLEVDETIFSLDDILPSYNYSLYNEGYLYTAELKKGRSPHNIKKWSVNYFVLRGTCLTIYETNPNLIHYGKSVISPLMRWNLGQLEIIDFDNYGRSSYIFGVKHKNGKTNLLKSKDFEKYLKWKSDLKAAILLTLDIDLRPCYFEL